MAIAFNEDGSTIQTGSAKVSIDKGQSTRLYHIPIDDPTTDIFTACVQILGSTNYAPSSDGRLNRTPPVADPVFPMYFAESIESIKGQGNPTQTEPAAELEVPTIGNFTAYDVYDFTVVFTQRQYSILPDSDILVQQGSWYPDALVDSTGDQQFFNYANEWTRWTETIPLQPSQDFISQQTGTMVFNSSQVPANTSFQGQINLPIPNQKLQIIWRGVPVRYITSKNSYIARNWRNRINQNPIQLPGINGVGDVCPAGSLLYVDYAYSQPYTPVTGYDIVNLYGNGDATSKLTDISFFLLYTSRTTNTGETLRTSISNQNTVASGHNLQPWNKDRGWHMCQTTLPSGAYRSFPMEILFTDPDSIQQGVIG